jgi:hypothetical protein
MSMEDEHGISGKKKAPKLGSGKRFKKLANNLARKGIRDPDALAASIGRKKFGNKKMENLAKKGRERHESE